MKKKLPERLQLWALRHRHAGTPQEPKSTCEQNTLYRQKKRTYILAINIPVTTVTSERQRYWRFYGNGGGFS